jgi:hypothetical protein
MVWLPYVSGNVGAGYFLFSFEIHTDHIGSFFHDGHYSCAWKVWFYCGKLFDKDDKTCEEQSNFFVQQAIIF